MRNFLGMFRKTLLSLQRIRFIFFHKLKPLKKKWKITVFRET